MDIWYIDEDNDDLFTYSNQLRKITQDKINVIISEPMKNPQEMAEAVLSGSDTVAVVIDQRLGDTKDGVSYNGLNLAQEIRKLSDKLPIYILTNHTGDLTSDEWEIEYVFSKDDFISKKRAISERIKRHIGIFFDIQLEREKRFSELLRKSISETLTKDELTEIENLRYSRSTSLLRQEASETAELKKILDDQECLLSEIKLKLEKMDDGK